MCNVYRYKFLIALSKGIRTSRQIFSWKPGGGRAGEAVHFVWRIPLIQQERDDNRAFRFQAECLADITKYHTRVKNPLFFAEVVNQSFIHSKAATSAMYKHLTGDILPRDKCKGKSNARIVAEMALACQDFDLIQDLRELNRRPKNTDFNLFWSEIKSLLESHARVDDRRHGIKTMLVNSLYNLKSYI